MKQNSIFHTWLIRTYTTTEITSFRSNLNRSNVAAPNTRLIMLFCTFRLRITKNIKRFST